MLAHYPDNLKCGLPGGTTERRMCAGAANPATPNKRTHNVGSRLDTNRGKPSGVSKASSGDILKAPQIAVAASHIGRGISVKSIAKALDARGLASSLPVPPEDFNRLKSK